MPRRRAGVLLPLELDLLDALVRVPDQHGFALGQAITADSGRSILGHGTMYKALARLETAGLLTSAWEIGDASELGRPLRRQYRITMEGRSALAAARPMRTLATRRGLATS